MTLMQSNIHIQLPSVFSSSHSKPLADYLSLMFSLYFLNFSFHFACFSNSALSFRKKIFEENCHLCKILCASLERVNYSFICSVYSVQLFLFFGTYGYLITSSYLLTLHFPCDWYLFKRKDWLVHFQFCLSLEIMDPINVLINWMWVYWH